MSQALLDHKNLSGECWKAEKQEACRTNSVLSQRLVMTAFSDYVLPRGRSNQFMPRGKNDFFPVPLPIQPLEKGFCESCSNFIMLSFHSSSTSTVLPPLPVPPRSNQINPPTPNKKIPALFCHLKESEHCTLKLKKKNISFSGKYVCQLCY